MAQGVTGRTRRTKPKKQERTQKRKRDDVDAEKLEEAVAELVRFSLCASSPQPEDLY